MWKNPTSQDRDVDTAAEDLIKRAQSDPIFLASLGDDPAGTVHAALTPDQYPIEASILTTIKIWLMGGKSKFNTGPYQGGGGVRG